MELILAIAGAGPLGFLLPRGLVLYLAAWAIVFPVQTIVVFSNGHGEPSYFVVNAVILAVGVGLNRFGARLRQRRLGIA